MSSRSALKTSGLPSSGGGVPTRRVERDVDGMSGARRSVMVLTRMYTNHGILRLRRFLCCCFFLKWKYIEVHLKFIVSGFR